MYNPIKDGFHKNSNSVRYNQTEAPDELKSFVHNYWEMKTLDVLERDFFLHVIPDACINILFDLQDTRIAAITYRETEYITLNLGKKFHFAGIQLFPGVWNGSKGEIQSALVDSPYQGKLPLQNIGNKLSKLQFEDFSPILSEFIRLLISEKTIVKNIVTERILSDLDTIESVEDMAASANISTRQLQRKLKETTNFSPHDFLKILRLQQSFRSNYLDFFVDQSHFIHNFKKITGYTPKEFFKTFDV